MKITLVVTLLGSFFAPTKLPAVICSSEGGSDLLCSNDCMQGHIANCCFCLLHFSCSFPKRNRFVEQAGAAAKLKK